MWQFFIMFLSDFVEIAQEDALLTMKSYLSVWKLYSDFLFFLNPQNETLFGNFGQSDINVSTFIFFNQRFDMLRKNEAFKNTDLGTCSLNRY